MSDLLVSVIPTLFFCVDWQQQRYNQFCIQTGIFHSGLFSDLLDTFCDTLVCFRLCLWSFLCSLVCLCANIRDNAGYLFPPNNTLSLPRNPARTLSCAWGCLSKCLRNSALQFWDKALASRCPNRFRFWWPLTLFWLSDFLSAPPCMRQIIPSDYREHIAFPQRQLETRAAASIV